MDQEVFAQRCESLSDDQLKLALAEVLSGLESGEAPLLTDEQSKLREREDRELINSAAAAAGVPESSPANSRDCALQLLRTLHSNFPEYRPLLESALDATNESDATLDLGLSLGLAFLLVSVGAAVMRPRAEGRTASSRWLFEIRGIPEIVDVIKAVLPFAHS